MLPFSLIIFFLLNINAEITFRVDPCPQVLNCKCLKDDKKLVQCFGVGSSKIEEIANVYGENIELLELYNWQDNSINFDNFSRFSNLKKLYFTGGEIANLNSTKHLNSLKSFSIERSNLKSADGLCQVIQFLPNIDRLSLKSNALTEFVCKNGSSIKDLDISNNMITKIELPDKIQILRASNNLINKFENIPTANIITLDISNNIISSWPKNVTFPNLRNLTATHLNFAHGFHIDAPKLEELILDQSSFTFIDFHQIKTPSLKKFSAAKLQNLKAVSGSLASKTDEVVLTETAVSKLPLNFLIGTRKSSNIKKFNFTSSSLECNECLLSWSLPVFEQSSIEKTCNFSRKMIMEANCTTGIANSTNDEIFGLYGKDTIIDCLAYGIPMPTITWYLFRPSSILGSYNAENDQISYENVSEISKQSYSILPGGFLVIHNANRTHVERYVCVAENKNEKHWKIRKFRLDYTNWYRLNVFKSVFWGGLAMSFIVCFVSFFLNITWILTRKSALWWIQRAERLSRVRKMVEAMEKYRTRQMESLHDKYTKRVQLVRDNYHQQVEALRVSYSAQSEKFRDYRAAQMDAVTSHLDSLRDNYNVQLARVREYGSKRSEQLWESYERQVNRMRTFSLQHRLKLMRQYKVKQRYLNKLLESLQTNSPDVQIENEEKIRAALEIDEPVELGMESSSRLSRTSSFHSLPEYLIDERGNVIPGIPPSNGEIRFSALPSTSYSPVLKSKETNKKTKEEEKEEEEEEEVEENKKTEKEEKEEEKNEKDQNDK